MRSLIRVTALCSAALPAAPVMAAVLHLPRFVAGKGSTITLRKRLHVNTLITQPGTAEIDWSTLYSSGTDHLTLPAAFKYTPAGPHVMWGRTEYSVAFDSVSVAELGGNRLTQFSQSVTLSATSVLLDGEKLDIAFAPQAVYFLRDERGARYGAVAIARYDWGRNSLGATVGWSAATRASETNPAGTGDVGCGFGRRLAASGLAGKFTPHVNALWERSTGADRIVSLFEGVEYQITERLAFDLGGQHVGVNGTAIDHQLTFGITLNVGKLQ